MNNKYTPSLMLGVIALLALVYRVIPSIGLVHKADAIVIGLMAEDIAKGIEFPLVYYGQFYMGALEAWLLAPLYFVIQPDWWTISFIPVFVSTIAVIPFYLLGTSVAGRVGGVITASLWAIPPYTINFYNVTPRGCYPEVVGAGALLLWYASKKLKGEDISPTASFVTWFSGGLSLWASLLAAPFLATAGMLTLVYAHRKIFTKANIGALLGLGLGLLPFMFVILRYGLSSPGEVKVENLIARTHTLYSTTKWLFIPYQDVDPGLALTYGGWFYFILITISLVMLVFAALYKLAKGRGSELLPLTIFSLLFVILFLLNSESIKHQARYLLPMVVPLFTAAGWMISIAMKKSRVAGLAILSVCLLSAIGVNSVVFANVKKGETQQREHLGKIVEQADRASIKSLVWGSEYEESYKLMYEAKRLGIDFRPMPWDGTRTYAINNLVEADQNTAVWVPLALQTLIEGFKSCCSGGYEKVNIGERVAVKNIRAKRWPSLSISPQEWIIHDGMPGLNDRKFSTTHHSNGSFTIELKTPEPITMIRAIYGGRQPQSTAILVSMDGEKWKVASPKAPISYMIPYGPKVYFRTLWVWEREYQEWNFTPQMAKFIRFDIEHPAGTEYDIHELFVYGHTGQSPYGEGVDIREAQHPTSQQIKDAAKGQGVSMLAANRWHISKLYEDHGRGFEIVLPSLRGFKSGSINSSRLFAGPGFAALVDSADAPELQSWLETNNARYSAVELGAAALFSIDQGKEVWFTGFTIIDYN